MTRNGRPPRPPPYVYLQFLGDFHQLIESFSPTLVKSHLFVLLAGLFVTVDDECRVLGPIVEGFEGNDCGHQERIAGHRGRRPRPVAQASV
jgi:hypothetical protein